LGAAFRGQDRELRVSADFKRGSGDRREVKFMTQYVIISYNTDQRFPNTEVKTVSKKEFDKSKESDTITYAFPSEADDSLPGWQQNWHKRINSYYEVESKDYTAAVKKAKKKFKEDRGGSMYSPRRWEDCLTLK